MPQTTQPKESESQEQAAISKHWTYGESIAFIRASYSSLVSDALNSSRHIVKDHLIQAVTLSFDPVPHYSSIISPLIQSKQQITGNFLSHLTLPAYSWNLAAIQRLTDYLHWYMGFVASYERDLQVAGSQKRGRLTYAREQGIPTLQALISQVHVEDEQQLEALDRLLWSFRSLAALTTEMEGRGVLVFRLVDDAVERLRSFGLVNPPGDRVLTTPIYVCQ